MANSFLHHNLTFNFIFLFTIFFSSIAIAKIDNFSRTISEAKVGIKKEKLSHLHFYFHDIVTSRNPTAIRVVQTPINTSTGFGTVVMIDDQLTVSPATTSKLVGRAQGAYALASESEFALLMVMNFAFLEGKYNGSTLSILGRNVVFSPVREMPIIGGSGLFRFARGYALAKTHTYNPETGDAVVEYNVYVLHY